MPRDLFGDVTRPSLSIGNRKWYTVPVSLFSHSAIVVLLIALPILAPAVMPSVFADGEAWITIAPPTPPPPPPIRVDHPKPMPNSNAAPIVAPDKVAPENLDLPDIAADQPLYGVIGGQEDLDKVLAPPPTPVTKAPPPVPVHVGGIIRQPQKTRNVDPVYPQMAQAARIQGIVIIEATIGADGRVINARLLRSLPMLDQAAIDAVRQWEFTPTLLNGVPVPVIMTVTVNFTLR